MPSVTQLDSQNLFYTNRETKIFELKVLAGIQNSDLLLVEISGKTLTNQSNDRLPLLLQVEIALVSRRFNCIHGSIGTRV